MQAKQGQGALTLLAFGLGMGANVAPEAYRELIGYASVACVVIAVIWFFRSNTPSAGHLGDGLDDRDHRLIAAIAATTGLRQDVDEKIYPPTVTQHPPQRDSWLQDAVYYAVRGRWLEPDELGFTDEAQINQSAKIVAQMRQMAADGAFLIWGLAGPGHAYQLIERGYWLAHQIDWGAVVAAEDQSQVRTQPGAIGYASRGTFSALKVSKAQVESIWPPNP